MTKPWDPKGIIINNSDHTLSPRVSPHQRDEMHISRVGSKLTAYC